MIHEFKSHSDIVRCVAFSPIDAKTLATSSEYNTVCIWALSEDGKTATPRHRLTGHTHHVLSIACSGDGLFLVSGSSDETIRMWSASTGECRTEISTPDEVLTIALSPDSERVVSGDDGCSIYIWETSTGVNFLGPLHGHTDSVWSVAYSPDGSQVLSGSADGSVVVWNSSTGAKCFGPFIAYSDLIGSISFHPSGEAFATSSSDRTIVIWDAKTFKPIRNDLKTRDSATSVQYSVDGRFLLTAFDGGLSMWDTRRGRVVSELTENGWSIWTAVFSPDGRWVASGRKGGTVIILEVGELGIP